MQYEIIKNDNFIQNKLHNAELTQIKFRLHAGDFYVFGEFQF